MSAITNFIFSTNIDSLSWTHIQNPFLLRRSIWALHHRLFNNQDASAPVANHDLFRAFMLCAIGSVLPYRNRMHERHPGAYYNAALQYLGTEFLTRGLDSVQDLLLICRFGIYHPIGMSQLVNSYFSNWQRHICMGCCEDLWSSLY